MFIIPLNVLMIAPVLYNSLLTKMTPEELFSVPGLIFHALGAANVQTTSGAQNYSTPKIDMDRRNIKQMPTLCVPIGDL